jgi:hypothetical protein
MSSEAASNGDATVTQVPAGTVAGMPDKVVVMRDELLRLFGAAIAEGLPALPEPVPAVVTQCSNRKHGDYQCNSPMQLFGRLKGKVRWAGHVCVVVVRARGRVCARAHVG